MSLAPGWTEHRAPSGQFYYFNAQSKESTYVRPTVDASSSSTAAGTTGKKKKEKPRLKEPVPGTAWLKVTTTEDNVFFSHPETKVSSWTVPDEIKEQVEKWEEEKKQAKLEEDRLRKEAEEAEAAKQREDERIMREAQEAEAKRVAEEARGTKRKTDGENGLDQSTETGPADQEALSDASPPKKKKQKAQKVGALEELDEGWQRQIAEEMAKEAAAADGQGVEEDVGSSGQNDVSKILTSEESKAMFKAMLTEKDIDPMAPWDNELPKFVADPRYTAVKTNKERRDLFDDFCKEKIREQRAAKQSAEKAGKLDPAQAYRSLLIDVVTSTRAHWEDFRRDHKKDTRFRSFGRDDREREKAFKAWLRELGERKRGDAKRAELKFEDLLVERVGKERVLGGAAWKDVRDELKGEPRYEGVGSSSLREEIWTRWSGKIRDEAKAAAADPDASKKAARERKERQEASLRAREEQVRRDKDAMLRDAGRSRMALGREEGEREYRTLLVDAVRDHTASWDAVCHGLERDPRFEAPSLTPRDKRDLFERHLSDLYDKRLAAVEAQFATHSPSLAARYPDVRSDLLKNSAVERLDVSERRLEDLFAAWQRRRNDAARRAFDAMLSESAFVEFWGRMRKDALSNKADKAKAVLEDDEEAEEEEDGGVVDLREMAKGIDLGEVEAVLRNDQRWIVFAHVPEQREQWMRDYLENLAAPKTTVYQK